jgi:tRNA-2-methylthio-N6-dimethylallyladenosine synthase
MKSLDSETSFMRASSRYPGDRAEGSMRPGDDGMLANWNSPPRVRYKVIIDKTADGCMVRAGFSLEDRPGEGYPRRTGAFVPGSRGQYDKIPVESCGTRRSDRLRLQAVKETASDSVCGEENPRPSDLDGGRALIHTFYIETFGCQMNERDSETIGALLSREGLKETFDPRLADVVVLNTCAVRESAESKVWSRLGKLAAMRRGGEMPVLVLAGCMAQIPENVERVRMRVPFVQVIAGPGNIERIPALVKQASGARKGGKAAAAETPFIAVSTPRTAAGRDESTQVLPEGLPRRETPGVSAYVTIMYGCDNFCAYCVVPFVRGPQVSRPRAAIREEVESLASRGYKEVTLLGQNVNAYGRDLGEKDGFSAILREVNGIPGIARVRYFTSHPRDFTREMVDAVRDCGKVCEHFHLPLQSGSDRILRLMNRGYSRDEYVALLDYIRERVPAASVTTDVIVGFPGETEKDFQDTLGLVRRAQFDGAFTFIFSPRKGTAAAKMKGQVSRAEKSRRMQLLVETQSEVTRARNRDLLGHEVEILVEGPDEKQPGAFRGRTRTNKTVIAVRDDRAGSGAPEIRPGDLVRVCIREAGTWYVKGPVAG